MALSRELQEKNVVAHIVCPGITMTEFWDKFPSAQKMFAKFLTFLYVGKNVAQGAENVVLGKLPRNLTDCCGYI
jgi:short-subunit dehydrogenase